MIIKLDLKVGEQEYTKRIYSEAEILSAISKVKFPIMVDDNSDITVNLANVCGFVHKIYIDGTNIKAEFELSETPFGKILEQLIIADIDIKFRLFGIGYVNEDHIVSGYEIIKVYVDMRK